MRVTDLRDQCRWPRICGSAEPTWLGRSCGAVSIPLEGTGTKPPQPALEYSLQTFSPHDIKHLLGSALIQTSPRIPSRNVGCLDVEVSRRQPRICLLGERRKGGIIIKDREERPQAVWKWKLGAVVKGNCGEKVRASDGHDEEGGHSRITSNARAAR